MKKVLKVLVLFTSCIMLSGCLKYDASIKVNEDHSMDFSFISAIKKEYANQMSNSNDYEKYKEDGYVVESYVDDEYEGFKVSKHYVSIDEASDSSIDTSTLTENDGKLFNVKKGFFKNIYTAKLESNETKEMTDKASMYEDEENSQSMNELIKQFDFKLHLSLPYAVESNNATAVSENKKILEWDLANMKDPYIEFTFSLYNWNNIWLTLGIVIIILCIVITVFRYLKGTKHRIYMSKENKRK